MKTLLFFFVVSGSALAAKSPLRALQDADTASCISSQDWTERSARFSVVVHADGSWAVVLDERDAPPQLFRALRECLHRVVADALADSAPTGKRVVVTKVLMGPRAPADRVPELRARFEQVRDAVADCVLGAFPPTKVHREIPVRLTLTKRGEVVVDSPGTDGGVEGGAATFCAQRSITATGGFAPGTTSWPVTLVVDGIGRLIQPVQPDGSAGSVCGAPQGDFASLLHGVECQPGLTCCNASGIMNMQRCMKLERGEHCPLLP